MKFLPFLLTGMLVTSMAQAQYTSEPLDMAQVRRFLADHPHHRTAFTSSQQGGVVCTDEAVMKAYAAYQPREARMATSPLSVVPAAKEKEEGVVSMEPSPAYASPAAIEVPAASKHRIALAEVQALAPPEAEDAGMQRVSGPEPVKE